MPYSGLTPWANFSSALAGSILQLPRFYRCLERLAKETLIMSMPRASAAKAGFILLDFADRLKAVPFKAILNQSFPNSPWQKCQTRQTAFVTYSNSRAACCDIEKRSIAPRAANS